MIYWGQKTQKLWVKLAYIVHPHVGEYSRIIFVLQGVQKNCQHCHFLEPLIAFIIQSLNYFFSYRGFFQFFWTPCKTKIVLQCSPAMEINHRCQISPYFLFFWLHLWPYSTVKSENCFSRYASSSFLTIWTFI